MTLSTKHFEPHCGKYAKDYFEAARNAMARANVPLEAVQLRTYVSAEHNNALIVECYGPGPDGDEMVWADLVDNEDGGI